MVEAISSGEDKVIVYQRYKGTSINNLFGMPSKEMPRGFDIAGIETFTIKDAKITDMWHVEEINKLVGTLSADK